ncbi:MAG: extracellular solute-binding protein [Planctomycetales bacterium]|nr:extracellular solute-binding protein [Planctomycetales bacterium]
MFFAQLHPRHPARATCPARLGIALGLLLTGCQDDTALVVYTALDSEFSEPLLRDFSQQTGIPVRPRFDSESTKTVGLTEAIISESRVGPTRCDVFWNNEILNTLRLRQRGLLEVYLSPIHQPYPAQYRAADGTWHGFAARARVLIVNTQRVPESQRPDSLLDLTDPQWRGQIGIAKPLFGTTATHAACLFAKWGDERAKEFFRALRANGVAIEAGNKQVALRVAAGQLALGLTDTDDAIIEQQKGLPVAIVFPDSAPGQEGTLFIPNTLAIVKGTRRSAAARKLVDYLLSSASEKRLAAGPSAQIPLNPQVRHAARLQIPDPVQAMEVDFAEAAEKWETTANFLRQEFLTP